MLLIGISLGELKRIYQETLDIKLRRLNNMSRQYYAAGRRIGE